MPETYIAQINANTLRAGTDRIVTVTDDGMTVGVKSRISKTKWTEILLENETTMRVENESVITVQRERPTAEERRAEDLRVALRWIDNQERGAVKARKDAQDKLAAESSDALVDVSSTAMVRVLEAQAWAEIWSRVELVSINSYLRDDELSRIESVRYVTDKIKEELIGHHRYASRSTSTWANAVEDVTLDCKARFVRDVHWTLAGLA